ncbi:hypothetical protein D3C80_686160 [compost metagenome]
MNHLVEHHMIVDSPGSPLGIQTKISVINHSGNTMCQHIGLEIIKLTLSTMIKRSFITCMVKFLPNSRHIFVLVDIFNNTFRSLCRKSTEYSNHPLIRTIGGGIDVIK